jgi:hypothetical protein
VGPFDNPNGYDPAAAVAASEDLEAAIGKLWRAGHNLVRIETDIEAALMGGAGLATVVHIQVRE